MRTRLPIPSNWQDFEALCHQLWKEIWSDPNAQRNGRAGQEQFGVDVFGRPVYRSAYAGVQCKDKDGRLGSLLTESQLLIECANAKAFRPELESFTLATTAASNQAIQTAARKINAEGQFPFDVHVWSWDEIEAEIACRPKLVGAFYQPANSENVTPNVKISVSAPKDQFFAFFSRPNIISQLGLPLKDSLIQVTYELCDNAFVHGGAQHVELTFEGKKLIIKDDGKIFNPIEDLDSTKTTKFGNLGSYVLDSFRKKFTDEVTFMYERESNQEGGCNVLTIDVKNAQYVAVPEVLDISVDLSAMFGRRGARGFAESIPIPLGTKELIVTVSDMFNVSGSIYFIQSLRERLPNSVLLVISHPRNSLLAELASLFDGSSVKFVSR